MINMQYYRVGTQLCINSIKMIDMCTEVTMQSFKVTREEKPIATNRYFFSLKTFSRLIQPLRGYTHFQKSYLILQLLILPYKKAEIIFKTSHISANTFKPSISSLGLPYAYHSIQLNKLCLSSLFS